MTYLFEHTAFGFCWWDLVALLVVLGVILVMVIKLRNQKKELKKLEDILADAAKTEAAAQKAAEELQTTETQI